MTLPAGGLLLMIAMVAGAGDAWSGQYPGRGDTGWVHAGKRDCCDHAIALAQNESAVGCQNTGGTPNPLRGGVKRRGFCEWESATDDDGAVLFRCYAEASVPCR